MSTNTAEPSRGVLARASCRVDLAGGTMDLWPLYLFHPGAVVVNLAIPVMTSCRIEARPGREVELVSVDNPKMVDRFADMQSLRRAKRFRHGLAVHLLRFFYRNSEPRGGLRMETHSQSPTGAGISGSSALMIASAAALARFGGRALAKEQLREIAQNVEAQMIGVPTGCQDYYPALYGGVNAVELDVDGIHRHALACSAAELDRRLVLAYTGAPRKSGINNWEVFKRHIDGDRRLFGNFERIGEIARAMRRALEASDWEETGRLLREEWKLRRTNTPGIATPFIDELIALARRRGAQGAKVCGAGGGGCVLFLSSPEARASVEAALREAGAQLLPAAVARQGVRVSNLDEARSKRAR
jgi:D-glycero-alpha-D-manno-heptose-7-phosphate kinase